MFTYEYPRPALTADCALFSYDEMGEKQILLIQRLNPPFANSWALPGGFMDMDETIEDCAHRELCEETGIQNVSLIQFKTYSKVDRDPRGRTVSVVFYAEIDAQAYKPKAGDDAKALQWFPVENLPVLAFDHQQIINELLQSIAAS